MRLDLLSVTWAILLAVILSSANAANNATSNDDKKERSPAETAPNEGEGRNLFRNIEAENDDYSEGRRVVYDRNREGKDLYDWFGLGVGQQVDPFMAKCNKGCLNGDFAECFKSRALDYFSNFFDEPSYDLTDSVRVVRMSRNVINEVNRQPFEYSTEPRSEDSEWDQLMKFALRKAERFVKTSAFEVSAPSWLMTAENEVYAPRFLDEIADEIDVLENKKDTVFSRHRLRKILIPMLIVLKLFKLKLLLFLPLILGLASFKKFLGFMAIVIPGIIGFFKLYKPLSSTYTPPPYLPSGLGYPGAPYKEGYQHDHGHFQPSPYNNFQNPDSAHFAQELAYQAYSRNAKGKDIEAEKDEKKRRRK